MSNELSWVPEGVNMELPSSARIYDYLLGGGHNFEMDRTLADRLLTVVPARDMARLNRAFLGRAVQYLVGQGIRQFLDLGSGVPTVGNVHEVAQAAAPESKVVYVDIEPVAVAHSELLLRDNPNAGAIQADLRDPETILNHQETRRLLDFTQPVALLMVGVLQFIPDADDPWAVIQRYRAALPEGSYLAFSAFTWDGNREAMTKAVEVFKNTQEPIHPRTRADILRFADGFELVEPGLVYTPNWRPETGEVAEEDVRHSNLFAAVGRKV
ncbi:SAM-dependent methyltransferase [Crossiella sp. SN42]|uniref:SAM-dependent methyltransferase n=1 Tax=Crossiella sp. SN42 TaxID=2944808 RepID=UPI00207CAEB6|nr:SAM-dependent methyltransferase [Crossiella sp. SN42]MCO1577973.1 SAM-dependent methyltransferase [Crossiella sp. SN42]